MGIRRYGRNFKGAISTSKTQAGKVKVSGNNGLVVFPTAYDTAPVVVAVDNSGYTFYVGNATTTGFGWSSATSVDRTISWIATITE